MTTYTMQLKHRIHGWQDQSVIVVFNPDEEQAQERDIRAEMNSYGPIAVRCLVERAGVLSFLLPAPSDTWRQWPQPKPDGAV